MLLFMGVFFALAFSVTLALSLPGDIAGIQANGIPVTTASHLSTGATEKVYGAVSPGQGIVIAVFSYQDSLGNSVTGRHVEPFWFNDSTGRVLVQMGSNYSTAVAIHSDGHAYPSNGSPAGFSYGSGDPIAIIGTVSTSGNLTVLQATNVADAPTAFSRATVAGDLEFFVPLFGVPTVVAVTGWGWQRGRLREHLLQLPQWTSKRPKALGAPPPRDEIRWLENPYPRRLRTVSIGLHVLSAGWVTLFLVVVVSPIAFPYAAFLATIAVVPIGLLFSLIFGVSLGSAAKRAPRRIGLSDNGVYLDYPSPPKNARSYIAWIDVRELEAPTQVNKRAAKVDTPLGTEYLLSLDPAILPELRAAFEAGRTPFRDRSAPIRPSVASLLGTGAPRSVAEVSWTPNPMRTRWMRNGALLLLLEIPALLLLAWLWPRIGFGQGDVLFILPAMVGVSQLWTGYTAVRAVGVSTVGIGLRERRGERTVLWSDIEQLTPMARGFRYRTYSGFAEAVPMVDATLVSSIAEAMAPARGIPSSPVPPSPPPESLWISNPVRRRARAYLVLFLVLPIGLMTAGVIWGALRPSDPNWVLLATLPSVVLVFSIYPFVLYRASPVRIAVTPDALFVDFGSRRPGPGDLRAIRLSEIARLTSSVGRDQPTQTTLGLPAVPILVITTGGVVLSGGTVSPELARPIEARLRPDQLKDWKVPP